MLFLLKNVKDSEICPCAKFRFNFIIIARNIANTNFSLKKALDPGLKHLELISLLIRLCVDLFEMTKFSLSRYP